MSNGDVPDGFKMTEIGPVPAEWSVSTVGDHCNVITGGTPRTEKAEYYDPPEIPWIKSGEVNKGSITQAETFISSIGLENSNARILPRDTVVIALAGRGRTRGTTAILQIECACNQSVACIVPTSRELDYRFLHYYLKSRYDHIRSLTGDEDRSGLNLALVRQIKLLIPPLFEQKRIATILSTIQAEEVKSQAVISALKELKKSLMRHLFTYGPVSPREAENVPLKDTEIGRMPLDWQVHSLGDLCTIQSGGTPSRSRSEFYRGNINWVKTLDLNDRVVKSTEEHITKDGLESIRGRIRPEGTVMVAMYGGKGTIGKCGILGVEAATNQAVCCIETQKHRLDSMFLQHYLVFARPSWMPFAFSTRKDPNISKTIVVNKLIPVPSLLEQKKIAHILSSVDSSLSKDHNSMLSLSVTFDTLLANLMTGKLRVNNLEVQT